MSSVTTNRIITQYEVTGLDQLLKVADGLDKISKEERDALNELKKLNTGFKETGKQGVQATADINKGFSGLNSTLKGVGGLLAGVFAVSQLKQFAAEIVATTAKFEQYRKAMDFATGSNKEGGRAFQFLVESAKKYGLSLEALTEGYKGFAASSNLAGTSIAETNRQFIAIAKASATLGLSSERTKLVLAGLGQIASKGVVSMEELRQQIGDSLPGAMGIGARAMGMTTQAFIKFVSEGKLLSAEFLPKFATEMEKTFGPTAAQNVNTLTGAQNKFNNSIDSLILAIGEKLGPLLKGAYALAGGIADQLAGIGEKSNAQTAESIALKRAESEIGRELLKSGVVMTVQNEKSLRQRLAYNAYLKVEKDIDEQLLRVANLRVEAAGDFNGRSSVRLAQSEKELEIMKLESEELLRQASIEITTASKVAAYTKEEYQARLKLLDLEERIALIRAKIANENAIDLAEAELKIKQKYTALKIAEDRKAEKAGIDGAQQARRLRTEEIELVRVETIRSFKEEAKAAKEAITKQLEAGNELQEKRANDVVESKARQEKLNAELVKLDQEKADAIKAIDKKSLEEKKQLESDLREITVTEAQIAADQLSAIYNGFYNIRQQQRQNELTLLQQNSDEEVRLAGDNQQRVNAIREQQRIKEREIQVKAFKAQQQAAIANAIFQATPTIIKYAINPATVPLAIAAGALLATQIAFIAAQPIPEFKEGTKGVPHKGGAIVGDGGERELMVTKSGKVSWSPAKPTLVNFREPTEVFNQAQLNEVFYGTSLSSKSKTGSKDSGVLNRLENIEKAIKGLPITQLSMDEAGFEKYIRTPKRTTQIRNNRFPAL